MKSRYSIKYFPFSPGVPWKLNYSKYIVPEVPESILYDHLKEKKIIVAAYGGLLESFFSLSILELINYKLPSLELFWAGNSEYNKLIELNGLAKIYSGEVNDEVLLRYPVPLFFDKANRAYFNCLNNYLDVKTYYLTKGYRNRRAAIKQIIDNGLFFSDKMFLPELRGLDGCPKELENNLAASNIHLDRPYVLVFPDRQPSSNHSEECLGWNVSQIKAFGALLGRFNIPLIVLSKNPQNYFYSFVNAFDFHIDSLLYLILGAKYVLSSSIDVLLLSIAISDARIISLPTAEEFKLKKNAKFISRRNYIDIIEDMKPLCALNSIIRGVE